MLFLLYIVNPIGERAHYYMSIMKEAHSKMRNNGESDESFKKRFTAERSRQFDILHAKEAIFSRCGWLFRKGEWVFHARVPVEAQWWKKIELLHQRAQSNGGKVECLIERCKGTRFHTLSVQWACFKAGRRNCPQLTKVTQDMEALENKKSNYNSILKGILKQHINKRRRKKENRRKSNERKMKRTENNVQRVYGIWKPARKWSSTMPCVPS